MMKQVSFLLLTVLLLSFSDGKATHYSKFQKWYQENKELLNLSVHQDDATYSVRYIPKEIGVFREVYNKDDISAKDLKELNDKYDKYYEFSFKMLLDNSENTLLDISDSEEDYTARTFYLLEEAIQDFTLIKDSGESKPLRCSFEQNYGATPHLTFHLVFEKNKNDQLKSLEYDDLFLGSGKIEFDLTAINELKIPQIK